MEGLLFDVADYGRRFRLQNVQKCLEREVHTGLINRIQMGYRSQRIKKRSQKVLFTTLSLGRKLNLGVTGESVDSCLQVR